MKNSEENNYATIKIGNQPERKIGGKIESLNQVIEILNALGFNQITQDIDIYDQDDLEDGENTIYFTDFYHEKRPSFLIAVFDKNRIAIIDPEFDDNWEFDEAKDYLIKTTRGDNDNMFTPNGWMNLQYMFRYAPMICIDDEMHLYDVIEQVSRHD